MGDVNDVSTGGCDPWGCPWDGGDAGAAITVEPREFVFGLDRLEQWISDVKRVARLDLGAPRDGRWCVVGYVWLQFGGASDAYLASTHRLAARGGAVHAITMATTSRALSKSLPPRYGFFHDVVEQLSLCKYRGRPHFGKLRDRAFTHPDCPLFSGGGGGGGDNSTDARYPGLALALEAQARHDPGRVFEPALFSRALAAGAPGSHHRQDWSDGLRREAVGASLPGGQALRARV